MFSSGLLKAGCERPRIEPSGMQVADNDGNFYNKGLQAHRFDL